MIVVVWAKKLRRMNAFPARKILHDPVFITIGDTFGPHVSL